jgi:hypothetical protein
MQIQAAQNGQQHPVMLPVWQGKPIGELSREDIYDDAIGTGTRRYECLV